MVELPQPMSRLPKFNEQLGFDLVSHIAVNALACI